LEVLPVHFLREIKPFIICFYPPLLDYDVSMDEVVELVVVIPTSPRSSKTESGCKSYHRFRVDDPRISGGSLPVMGAVFLADFCLENPGGRYSTPT
jgi:hypothetical protein